MAANLLKVLATVFALAVVFGDDISAETQTHHVVPGGEEDGWVSDAGVGSWLLGRVFRVGDKLWFNIGNGNKDNIVVLESPEQLLSCDNWNTIRLFTDQLVLENCIKGLTIPASIELFWADKPETPEPDPIEPEPNHIPSPQPHPDPKPRPVCPPPPSPSPDPPPPSPAPPQPPPPSKPSVAVNLEGFSLALFAGLVVCYMIGLQEHNQW